MLLRGNGNITVKMFVYGTYHIPGNFLVALLELLSDPKSTFGTMTSNDPCETRIESPGWGFILPEI